MDHKVKEKIIAAVEAELDFVVTLRHRLHQCPEPGFAETQTAAIVAEELRLAGYTPQTELAKTGIVADLDGAGTGKYLILRCDMDGLPVMETTDLPYQSQRKGYAHCCGHDGHTAILVGLARIMRRVTDLWPGRIRFLFQPAEEKGRGAWAMIQAGALGPRKPDAFLTLHAWPGLPADSVASMPGALMAASDFIKIKVTGRGGHGAYPHYTRNPLHGMARIVEALKHMNTAQRVVSLCTAKIGHRPNTVSASGTMTGTLRTLCPYIREQTKREIEEKVISLCSELGLEGMVKYDKHCPAVVNDSELYKCFREAGEELLGPGHVHQLESPSMGSEDFGYFLDHAPGFLFRLGMGEDSAQLHQSNFDFNDEALRTGMLMLAGMAVAILEKEK
jgi:amidohydrolase